MKEPVDGVGPPTARLFLLFDDGTYYEFYRDNGAIYTTSGSPCGSIDEVLAYMGDSFKPVFVKYNE